MPRSFNKSTRYGLYAAMEMARACPEASVSVSQVASRYAIPVTVLAKVFQHLVRSGIAIGTRGARGGYSLARPASQLTVLDVIEAIEPPRSRSRPLWAFDRVRPEHWNSSSRKRAGESSWANHRLRTEWGGVRGWPG